MLTTTMCRVFIILIIILEASTFSFELRVVNGTRAESGEFPFMVSIRNSNDGSHSCGGTIISPSWILTAAHCAAGLKPQALNIQYGVSKISEDGPNIVNVSEIVVYWGYYFPTVLNDIALLRLQEPIKFGTLAQAIRLPRMYQFTTENTSATLIGWGLNKSGGTIQEDLQKVKLKIYSKEECSKRQILTIHPTNICAGIERGGKGQCNGDSGGPLIVNGRQVGISSWSIKPCTVPPYPGVYTEVANFIDWINFVMMGDDGQEDYEYFI